MDPAAMDAAAIRRRLVELDDEIRALPADAFAEKHARHLQRDELRRRLRDLIGDELDEMNDAWAIRASRKGDPAVAEDERLGAARIVSPTEGGSGAN